MWWDVWDSPVRLIYVKRFNEVEISEWSSGTWLHYMLQFTGVVDLEV
jgi:hypothetical protein